jgi:hypothetical protein
MPEASATSPPCQLAATVCRDLSGNRAASRNRWPRPRPCRRWPCHRCRRNRLESRLIASPPLSVLPSPLRRAARFARPEAASRPRPRRRAIDAAGSCAAVPVGRKCPRPIRRPCRRAIDAAGSSEAATVCQSPPLAVPSCASCRHRCRRIIGSGKPRPFAVPVATVGRKWQPSATVGHAVPVAAVGRDLSGDRWPEVAAVCQSQAVRFRSSPRPLAMPCIIDAAGSWQGFRRPCAATVCQLAGSAAVGRALHHRKPEASATYPATVGPLAVHRCRDLSGDRWPEVAAVCQSPPLAGSVRKPSILAANSMTIHESRITKGRNRCAVAIRGIFMQRNTPAPPFAMHHRKPRPCAATYPATVCQLPPLAATVCHAVHHRKRQAVRDRWPVPVAAVAMLPATVGRKSPPCIDAAGSVRDRWPEVAAVHRCRKASGLASRRRWPEVASRPRPIRRPLASCRRAIDAAGSWQPLAGSRRRAAIAAGSSEAGSRNRWPCRASMPPEAATVGRDLSGKPSASDPVRDRWPEAAIVCQSPPLARASSEAGSVRDLAAAPSSASCRHRCRKRPPCQLPGSVRRASCPEASAVPVARKRPPCQSPGAAPRSCRP